MEPIETANTNFRKCAYHTRIAQYSRRHDVFECIDPTVSELIASLLPQNDAISYAMEEADTIF